MECQAGVALAKAFMRGEIEPFPEPIEDSERFVALSGVYSAQNAAIESAVMELAHGACHTLTTALSGALGLDSVLIITDTSGMPVHSGLYQRERGLIFDANGAHRIEDSLIFWSRLAGSKCAATEMDVDDLCSLSGCDEDEAAIALEDFDLIAGFIQSASQASNAGAL